MHSTATSRCCSSGIWPRCELPSSSTSKGSRAHAHCPHPQIVQHATRPQSFAQLARSYDAPHMCVLLQSAEHSLFAAPEVADEAGPGRPTRHLLREGGSPPALFRRGLSIWGCGAVADLFCNLERASSGQNRGAIAGSFAGGDTHYSMIGRCAPRRLWELPQEGQGEGLQDGKRSAGELEHRRRARRGGRQGGTAPRGREDRWRPGRDGEPEVRSLPEPDGGPFSAAIPVVAR